MARRGWLYLAPIRASRLVKKAVTPSRHEKVRPRLTALVTIHQHQRQATCFSVSQQPRPTRYGQLAPPTRWATPKQIPSSCAGMAASGQWFPAPTQAASLDTTVSTRWMSPDVMTHGPPAHTGSTRQTDTRAL